MRQLYMTAAQWTAANPTLLAGEYGVESDTGVVKCGDGSTAWASLGMAFSISAYILTLLNDADAATARATLGISKYDTGWVSNSDWTNQELTVTHNLGAAIDGLIIKFFIASDGSGTAEQEVSPVNLPYATSVYGIVFINIDTNSFKIQTGKDGVQYMAEDGSGAVLAAGAYYWRCSVYKIG